MPANDFSKEERVGFEQILEGFQDALVLSNLVARYNPPDQAMERAANTWWRPMPYIIPSYDGADQTANFNKKVQLSVPSTLGFRKSSPWTMNPEEFRDAQQNDRLRTAARQRLASDINRAVNDTAALQGTLVVKRTGAATGYDDVAQMDSLMNEQGVQDYSRYGAVSSRDYNGMAGNLAARQTLAGKALTAYDRAYIDMVASFDLFKMDYSTRLEAAAGGGGITIDTQTAAGNFYEPRATSTSATGERSNVDNRYQTITVSATANVAPGDCFTIAGVEAVHQITKGGTGNLKTFRVISVDSGTTMTISPAIVSNQGGTDSEEQYQNVIVTESANAAIVFLNTATAPANPFWFKDSIELVTGSLAIPSDSGAAVLRGSTDNGIELVMQKQYDINTTETKMRMDILFGVVNTCPEMNGIMLFNQP